MLSSPWQCWLTVKHLCKPTSSFWGCLCYSTESATRKPAISQKVKFVDQLRIVARGGHGGGGSSALFGRTGHHPRAAGGNGAPGGNVLLRATCQLTGLGSIPLHIEAERGGHGGKQWMEGKKGPDKVVPVPLGTMVWRLVQLRGQGTHTPHGVTPHTQAAAQHLMSQQPHSGRVGQQQRPATPGASDQPRSPCETAESSSVIISSSNSSSSNSSNSSSSSSSSHRRRLFNNEQLQSGLGAQEEAATGMPAHDTQMTHEAMELKSAGSSNQGNGCLQGLEQQTARSTAVLLPASDDASSDQLYEDLVTGKMLLSNSDKLHLLHHGSLEGQHHGLGGWGGELVGQGGWMGDGLEPTSSSESDTSETEEELDQDDSDGQAQQQFMESEWKGLGEHGEVEGRHFNKQQVWSILGAQAELLGVLDRDSQELLVAQGGRGGRGNAAAASQHKRPASRVRSDGQPGQEVLLWLQLRLMADVALVGLPNVGKSSLIAALTGARAQVGSYAFTTLRPQLGALLPSVPDASSVNNPSGQHHPADFTLDTAATTGQDDSTGSSQEVALAAAAATAFEDDSGLTGHKLLLADLPGLVPGAHLGKGRGVDFLRHLHKARCIALVVDMTGTAAADSGAAVESHAGAPAGCSMDASPESSSTSSWQAVVPHSPEQQLQILLEELRCFDAQTVSMPMLVVANKVDALSAETAAVVLQQLKAATHLPIIPVSAQAHLGLWRLKQSLELLVAGCYPRT